MYKIILLSLIIYPTISLTCDPYTKNNSRLEQYQKMTKELITEKTKIEQLKKIIACVQQAAFALAVASA